MNNIYIDKRSGSSREARHRRIDVTLVTLTEDNAMLWNELVYALSSFELELLNSGYSVVL